MEQRDVHLRFISSGLEQLLSSLLNEIDAANNRQTEATPEAWDSITDPSLRSFQELLVDGPDTQVAIEARYNNWRGEEELLISHVSWAQIATIADEHSRAGADSESKKLGVSPPHPFQSWMAIFLSCAVCAKIPRGSVDYTVSIKVGSKRSAGTKDTITIQMIGSQGRVSGYATLGNNWKPGDERSMVLSGLKEVGAVVQVELTTSGNDGVDFEEVWVTHTENPNTIVDENNEIVKLREEKESGTSTGTKQKTIDVGSLVKIGSGKYDGCIGTISQVLSKYRQAAGLPRLLN